MNINRAKEVCLSACKKEDSVKSAITGSGGLLSVRTFALVTLLSLALVVLFPQSGTAQSIPTTNRGWIGLKSGTQPPAGVYVTTFLWTYNFDTLKTNDGRTIGGTGVASVNQVLPGILFSYVSEGKVLGGNYSASFALPLA